MRNYMFYNVLTINIEEKFNKFDCNRLTQCFNMQVSILNKD